MAWCRPGDKPLSEPMMVFSNCERNALHNWCLQFNSLEPGTYKFLLGCNVRYPYVINQLYIPAWMQGRSVCCERHPNFHKFHFELLKVRLGLVSHHRMIFVIHKSSEWCSARSSPLIKTPILYHTAGPRPSDRNVRFVQRIMLTTVLHKFNVSVTGFSRRKVVPIAGICNKMLIELIFVCGIMQQCCKFFLKMYVYIMICLKRYFFGYNVATSSWLKNDNSIT